MTTNLTGYPLRFVGEWDAAANKVVGRTTAEYLKSGRSPFPGIAFFVTTAGTTNLDGIDLWEVGDIVFSDGFKWRRLAGPGAAVINPWRVDNVDFGDRFLMEIDGVTAASNLAAFGSSPFTAISRRNTALFASVNDGGEISVNGVNYSLSGQYPTAVTGIGIIDEGASGLITTTAKSAVAADDDIPVTSATGITVGMRVNIHSAGSITQRTVTVVTPGTPDVVRVDSAVTLVDGATLQFYEAANAYMAPGYAHGYAYTRGNLTTEVATQNYAMACLSSLPPDRSAATTEHNPITFTLAPLSGAVEGVLITTTADSLTATFKSVVVNTNAATTASAVVSVANLTGILVGHKVDTTASSDIVGRTVVSIDGAAGDVTLDQPVTVASGVSLTFYVAPVVGRVLDCRNGFGQQVTAYQATIIAATGRTITMSAPALLSATDASCGMTDTFDSRIACHIARNGVRHQHGLYLDADGFIHSGIKVAALQGVGPKQPLHIQGMHTADYVACFEWMGAAGADAAINHTLFKTRGTTVTSIDAAGGGRFTGTLVGGILGVGSPGMTPAAQAHVQGTGHTTGVTLGSTTITDAGASGGMVLLEDISNASGSGGTLAFKGITTGKAFAALKGLLQNGTTNSIGDLGFFMRSGVADTSLTERWRLQTAGHFLPAGNNLYNLGQGGGVANIKDIFTQNAVTVASDARIKTVRGPLNEAEQRVAARIRERGPVFYQYNEALAEKGEDARLHLGFIAQEIIADFEAEGLDAFRYGMVCADPKIERRIEWQKINVEVREWSEDIKVENYIEDGIAKTREVRRLKNDIVMDEYPVYGLDGELEVEEVTIGLGPLERVEREVVLPDGSIMIRLIQTRKPIRGFRARTIKRPRIREAWAEVPYDVQTGEVFYALRYEQLNLFLSAHA